MRTNVGANERIVRLIAGALLLIGGWRWMDGRRSKMAMATGGELLATGVTCWCPGNAALGRDSSGESEEVETLSDVPA